MTRLILYESENHVEVLSAYIRYFIKLPLSSIEVYCNKNVKAQLPEFSNFSKISFHNLNRDIASDSMLREILILTSPVILKKLRIPAGIKVYYLVHNIHSFFFPWKYMNFFNLPSWLKYSAFPYLINKRNLHKLQGFIFIDANLRATYGDKIRNLYKEQEQIVIPTYQPTDRKQNSNKKIVIAIPGKIDPKRRDYKLLVDVISKIKRNDLIFEFLGEEDIQWKKKINTSNNHRNELRFYNTSLPMSVYYERLSSADYILFLSKQFKKYGGVKERIGYSTYSAVLIDIWSLASHAIIPDFIPVPRSFEDHITKYATNKELILTINSLRKTKSDNNNFRETILKFYDGLLNSEVKSLLEEATKS